MTFVYILTIVYTLFNANPHYTWAGAFDSQRRCDIYLAKAQRYYAHDQSITDIECIKVPVQH